MAIKPMPAAARGGKRRGIASNATPAKPIIVPTRSNGIAPMILRASKMPPRGRKNMPDKRAIEPSVAARPSVRSY